MNRVRVPITMPEWACLQAQAPRFHEFGLIVGFSGTRPVLYVPPDSRRAASDTFRLLGIALMQSGRDDESRAALLLARHLAQAGNPFGQGKRHRRG